MTLQTESELTDCPKGVIIMILRERHKEGAHEGSNRLAGGGRGEWAEGSKLASAN